MLQNQRVENNESISVDINHIMIYFFNLVVCAVLCRIVFSHIDSNFKQTLTNGIAATLNEMKQIETDWEIGKYPSFLLSCGMTKVSWEMLIIRLQTKILTARFQSGEQFTISFMVCSTVFGGRSSSDL
jgi:hypothetical protein